MPRAVIISAAILICVGIVVGEVSNGVRFNDISSPVTMLPLASRVMGLIIIGLFSFSRSMQICRGCPVCTKRTIRKV